MSTFAAFSKSGFSGQLNSKFQTSGQIDHQMPQCAVCSVVCSVQCAAVSNSSVLHSAHCPSVGNRVFLLSIYWCILALGFKTLGLMGISVFQIILNFEYLKAMTYHHSCFTNPTPHDLQTAILNPESPGPGQKPKRSVRSSYRNYFKF